ncbi:MAG: hypothetical protein LBK70_00450 [Clostridiales bacterium]|jgi:hypothetical protein|nr:hypothetical protein [Clostridiales bacterium]
MKFGQGKTTMRHDIASSHRIFRIVYKTSVDGIIREEEVFIRASTSFENHMNKTYAQDDELIAAVRVYE